MTFPPAYEVAPRLPRIDNLPMDHCGRRSRSSDEHDFEARCFLVVAVSGGSG